MGLNIAEIKYLKLVQEKFGVSYEKTAMLGRQNLIISDEDLINFCNLIGYHDDINKLRRTDGYSENVLSQLFQAESIASFDYSDYENATDIVDLNEPVSNIYDERYSLVLDGGTLEHVFNYPIALQNAMRMCEMGGVLVLLTPTNNYNGHGFYQFSPDLFMDVLNSNGFCVEDISYVEEYGNEIYTSYKVIGNVTNDKLITQRRALVYVCAKKIKKTPLKLIAQQSKWQVSWGNAIKLEDNYLQYYDLDREINCILGNNDECEYNKIYGKRILLYGAGMICHSLISKKIFNSNKFEVVGIADKKAEEIDVKDFLVKELEYFNFDIIDVIVITTTKRVAATIKKELIEKKYDTDKIMDLDKFLYYSQVCLY